MEIDELLKQRRTQYADAWRKTGILLHPVAADLATFLSVFPEGFYNWIIIFNKLVRLLGDPTHLDSWQDIEGYAHLVREYLEKEAEHDISSK